MFITNLILIKKCNGNFAIFSHQTCVMKSQLSLACAIANYVKFFSGSKLDTFGPLTIWSYLLSRNLIELTVAWIHNSFHDTDLDLDTKVTWPVTELGKIPEDCVNKIGSCTVMMKNAVLKAFARLANFISYLPLKLLQ